MTILIWIGAIAIIKTLPPATVPARPIAGTSFSHEQLEEFFPFGYVVISQLRGRWTYSPHPSGKVEWRVDWNKVIPICDFSTGYVDWHVEQLDAFLDGVSIFWYKNMNFQFPILPEGRLYAFGLQESGDQPTLLTCTLNADQHFPVFVIGGRILPKLSVQKKQ